MVNEEVNKSWAIRTSTDELLNFIIFTGCMYNLIDDKNFDDSNTPWPTNLLNTDCKKLQSDKLKLQWKLWFNNAIEEKCNNINPNKMCILVNEKWEMQAGGKSAISFYEIIVGNKFCDYIEELECQLNKKSKPFNFYIDMVYTGVPDVLDINDEYVIVTPNGYLSLDREWWIKKFIKLM